MRLPVGDQALGPIRTLTFALLVFGAASALHGSGFLAVYIAGLLVADGRYPGHRATERFHTSLASLAEIVVFVALGLTVSLDAVFSRGIWLDGLIVFGIVALVARPLATLPLLLAVRTNRREDGFIAWAGLKGAVPILLASFALARAVPGADRIYAIVFVVVTLSVTIQAATIPALAQKLRIPMRPVEDEQWA